MKFTVPKVVFCICMVIAFAMLSANAAIQENDTTYRASARCAAAI